MYKVLKQVHRSTISSSRSTLILVSPTRQEEGRSERRHTLPTSTRSSSRSIIHILKQVHPDTGISNKAKRRKA